MLIAGFGPLTFGDIVELRFSIYGTLLSFYFSFLYWSHVPIDIGILSNTRIGKRYLHICFCIVKWQRREHFIPWRLTIFNKTFVGKNVISK